MSTQNQTHARTRAPVSSHPLFPAIVALWFGALFGLGSLAVRASLIESLVLSSHLDVIVPMTAPPLGITARILLALAMAAIGIAAGAMIARRIARPKPVARQRRRSAAGEVSKAQPKSYAAPAQVPEYEAEPEVAASGRRRALAVAPDELAPQADYRLHAAPLPGGAPEIFDVTQIELTEAVALPPRLAEAAEEAQPLELSGFASPELTHATHIAEEPSAEVEADQCLVLDEPVLAASDTCEALADRQVFGQPQQSFGGPLGNDFAAPAPATPASEVQIDPAPPQARAFDAAPADHAAAAEPALPPQSFDAPSAAPVAVPVPDETAMEISAMHNQLRRFVGPAEVEAPLAVASHPQQPAEASALPTPPRADLGDAGQRIASANLAELSSLELIERFALALQQRRHSGAMPDGLVAAVASLGSAELAQAPEPVAAPISFAPPVPPSVPQTLAAPELPHIPAGFDPAPCDMAEADIAPSIPAPSPLSLPAALRPIDFSEYEDHDDHQTHVPPRSIVMPAAAEAAAPPVATDGDEAVEAEAEADVLEEGYSSLLDLSRTATPRQTLVRIEEPVADSAAVEPVVIFPGQDARVGMRFARPVEVDAPIETLAAPQAEPAPVAAPASEPGVTTLRRFDAPGAAAPAQDPAEAERALRSALATLQRMSGAA